MKSLSLLSAFAASVSATKLLLPLYAYPQGDAWDYVYQTIAANPQLPVQVVINVDSGPGDSTPGVNSDWITGTAKLNSYPNVEVLGYVHCLYDTSYADEVNQNVSDWAGWNTYTEANISISGIFYDEAPNSQGSAGDNDVPFMQSLITSANSAFGSHQFTSIFNTGAASEHEEYWELATYVVVYEEDASGYSNSILTQNIPSGKANQSSILIPDIASSSYAGQAQTWLEAMAAAGVGSANILNGDYVTSATEQSPADVGAVMAILVAAQGLPSSSASTSSSSSSGVSDAVVASTTQAASTYSASSTASSSSAGPTHTHIRHNRWPQSRST